MSTPLGAAAAAPNEKDYSKMICAGVAHTSTGAAGVETLTIDNDYPPIDMGIQSPVLAIILIENETPANDQNEVFLPSGQMARGTAPDSAGEFEITGERTIDIYQTNDLNGNALIFYIPKGTGHVH